ncbi:MAG: hypothetical protein WC961_08075 [Anaerovoracaceae bacterium]
MAKMYFAKTVRYEGSEYPPNTAFEVKDADVDDLKKAGGWIIEKPKATKVDENKEPEKSELDILREKAIELGINFKGNWGAKKLSEAIAEAEQA